MSALQQLSIVGFVLVALTALSLSAILGGWLRYLRRSGRLNAASPDAKRVSGVTILAPLLVTTAIAFVLAIVAAVIVLNHP